MRNLKNTVISAMLMAIMLFGTTFAHAGIIVAGRDADGIIVAGRSADGIIVAGAADEPCDETRGDKEGIIVAGIAGIIVAGLTGLLISDFSGDPADETCGIIVAG